MKLVSISGTHGCGKTTAIKALTTILSDHGFRCAVIVNEEGRERYDPDFIHQTQLTVEHLRGG